jgi:phosphonate transport system permease protein
VLALGAAYLVASFRGTEFNLYELVAGRSQISKITSDLLHPDLSWWDTNAAGAVEIDPVTQRPRPGTLQVLLGAMNQTIQIGLVGTVVAVLLSIPLSFVAARNLTRGTFAGRVLFGLTRSLLNVLRAFPPIILAVIFVFMVGPGPFPGVLALALHSIGTLGKLFAEAIEAVDHAPVEAVQATGASNLLVVWFGVVPQVVPQFTSFSLYRWDMNIRESVILGIVGAGGIGFMLDQYTKLFQYSRASTCFLIILVAVSVLDWASSYLREKLG